MFSPFGSYYSTADSAANKALDVINGYRTGSRKRLKTRFPYLNSCIANGFEYNTVNTIAGRSSSGKSSLLNMCIEDFIEDDPKTKVLFFSMEMSDDQQILKLLSSQLKMPMRDLYSADKRLDESTVEKIKVQLDKLRKYPIIFVTQSVTTLEIEMMVKEQLALLQPDESLVVAIDHTLLLKGVRSEEFAKSIIDDLQRRLIFLKKLGRVMFIQLAQLNRNIDEPSRIEDPQRHFPIASDLSDSSAMQNASDVVLVIHNPSHLNITEYGVAGVDCEEKIFIHIIKNRFFGKIGKCCMYEDDLANNNLHEIGAYPKPKVTKKK